MVVSSPAGLVLVVGRSALSQVVVVVLLVASVSVLTRPEVASKTTVRFTPLRPATVTVACPVL